MSNIQKIERELSARQKNLVDLVAALDAAMGAGDGAEVNALQLEINTEQMLLASTVRRLNAARQEVKDEYRARKVQENTELAAIIDKSVQDDIALVVEIQATLDTLVHQLIEYRKHGNAANEAARKLLGQLPIHEQENFNAFARDVGNDNSRMGASINSTLKKSGVLPPDRNPCPDIPALVDVYTDRSQHVRTLTRKLLTLANAERAESEESTTAQAAHV